MTTFMVNVFNHSSNNLTGVCPAWEESSPCGEVKKEKQKIFRKKPDFIIQVPWPLQRQQQISYTATEIPFMYSQKRNYAASVPFSTSMCLWAIYIFPGSVRIFSCSKIGRPIVEIYKSPTDPYKCGNWAEVAQFLFWEYLFQILGIVSLQRRLLQLIHLFYTYSSQVFASIGYYYCTLCSFRFGRNPMLTVLVQNTVSLHWHPMKGIAPRDKDCDSEHCSESRKSNDMCRTLQKSTDERERMPEHKFLCGLWNNF